MTAVWLTSLFKMILENFFDGVKAALKRLQDDDAAKDPLATNSHGAADEESNLLGCDSDDEVNSQAACVDDSQPPRHWNLADALKTKGHIRKITINHTKDGQPLKEPRVILVPQTLLYHLRGESLRWLNFYEYLGCIRFVNSHSDCNPATDFKEIQRFPMHEDFEASWDCHALALHPFILLSSLGLVPG